MLRRSFQCATLAIFGICAGLGFGGMARLIVATISAALFVVGLLLSLINIGRNLARPIARRL
jgi:hypothetical protein